ncbi:hypothetical protein L218DRAFT_898154 [Marasmius fiardii PR-910]|nr:hypothetical protein L218DRAFT_898154 [Marasmius fiardii PR-910]
MVLAILASIGTKYFPAQYTIHIVTALVSTFALYILFQGRKTNRERDLHGRVILITGAFTPLGLTLLKQLAERGAHVIALTPFPVSSEYITTLIDLLRSTTKNELVYAEQCDLNAPASIQMFCKRFLQGEDKRLDALIFAHEYESLGTFSFVTKETTGVQEERDRRSLATFLMTTLLLPSLLTAPAERDIRIINVVNRFYAAAIPDPSFFYSNLFPSLAPTSSPRPTKRSSLFFLEGSRSLQAIIVTRHLQRILDALPAAQVPKTAAASSAVPVVNPKNQKSNIVAISVSPGVSRSDTIGSMLGVSLDGPRSRIGIFLYILSYPILRILAKAPSYAMQSILHVLFLPTPFKILSASHNDGAKTKNEKSASDSLIDKSLTETAQEVLKPGALYAECATVVGLKVPPPPPPPEEKAKRDQEEKQKQQATPEVKITHLPDDEELGGERAGTLVWEAYEAALRVWEKSNPSLEEFEREQKEREAKAKSNLGNLE